MKAGRIWVNFEMVEIDLEYKQGHDIVPSSIMSVYLSSNHQLLYLGFSHLHILCV